MYVFPTIKLLLKHRFLHYGYWRHHVLKNAVKFLKKISFNILFVVYLLLVSAFGVLMISLAAANSENKNVSVSRPSRNYISPSRRADPPLKAQPH